MTEPYLLHSRPRALLWVAALLSLLATTGCAEGGVSSERRTLSGALDWAVFINEIHYDDVGPDTRETIEVAGRAGTDLSSFRLFFYDGRTGRMYDVLQLEGTLGDEGAGYGALAFPCRLFGLQNGGPDGIALVTSDTVVSFVSYEGTFTALDGPAAGLSSMDLGVSESSDRLRSGSLQKTGTVDSFSWVNETTTSWGSLNVGQHFPQVGSSGGASPSAEACGEASTAVSQVQGPGTASPLEGSIVRVEGVVVATFPRARSQPGGFFLQATPGDGDPRTSDAIFVEDHRPDEAPVRIGDHVRAVGTVKEEEGMTRLAATDLAICGIAPLPDPTPLPLPYRHQEDLERLEGMLVVGRDLTVTDVYDLGRLGRLTLATGGRLFHPGSGTGNTVRGNAERRIVLDDGQDQVDPYPILFEGDDGVVRVGDTVAELVGVLQDDGGQYLIQPLNATRVRFHREGLRPSTSIDVSGQLRIASLNLSNYFLTLGGRGADTHQELVRQREKLISTVVGLDADILGLQELENRRDEDGAPAALNDFIASVNAALGSNVYARAPDSVTSSDDTIRTALIYKPELLELLPITLTGSERHGRPATAQAFSYLGDTFSVVVNHFKSKAGCPKNSADGDADQGQGCWNRRRTEQAQELLDLVSRLQALTEDEDVIIVGDLNAYPDEDPIALLVAGGLINPTQSVPAHERYSYVFRGESGVLDYLMTSPSVNVSDIAFWHVNADEPPYLDYNMEHNPSSAYRPDPFRSSDHDPVVAGFRFTPRPRLLLASLVESATTLLRQPGIAVSRKLRLETLLTEAQRAVEHALTLGEASPILAAAARSCARRSLLLFTQDIEVLGRGPAVSQRQVVRLRSLARRVVRALE